MTRTLVLTVDRDNDLGVKTGIRGPVVGRRQVMAAALKLGIADPEESDTNAILGALSQHDNLAENNAEEEEVEIAILTGMKKSAFALTERLLPNWKKSWQHSSQTKPSWLPTVQKMNLFFRLYNLKFA